MLKRDPRLDPKEGDILRNPKNHTIRAVTQIKRISNIQFVFFRMYSVCGRVTYNSVQQSEWQKWCLRQNSEIIKQAGET